MELEWERLVREQEYRRAAAEQAQAQAAVVTDAVRKQLWASCWLVHLLSRAAGSLLLFQYTCLLSSKRIVYCCFIAQFAPAQITRTTAEPRPNAYIPDDIGIPKPYGNCAIVAQLCSEAWFRVCSPLCWVWVRRCFGTIQTVGVGSRVVTHESTNDQACGNMKSLLRNLVITHVCSRRVHA